ncbi:endonuclease/exonuclease/phosphatase family protein [Klebsiella spallanzanii]|uniref:endonuclease/exonuclease/phosphatase family protein n=1 Tax=Klebsiella spallanzanii TaxID=2587528 RepID=UPI00115746BC|nr:endonuclease/exonuclease/phosphatase family protein [Klebsiella spallanzanii]VUS80881.1 hypothetical protein SB6419_01254 [Klebsiella spallanzanii]
MKHSFSTLMICLTSLTVTSYVNAQEGIPAAANENELVVLTPSKGGTTNKIYAKSHAPEIKVATWNIAAGRIDSLPNIANAIKALDADIIALSEVDKNTQRSGKVDQLSELKRLTGMYGVFGKAIDFEGGEYGIAVLSRYPISKEQTLPLPSPKVEQSVILATEIQKPGFDSPVIFIANHMDWHEDPAVRMMQLHAINDFAVGNTESTFPHIESSIKILAGDFNDVQGSTVMNGFKRYWHNPLPESMDSRSWPAINPAVDLDHILTFKGQRWQAEKIYLPVDQQSQLKTIDWPKLSDHLPLLMELKLLEQ